MNCYFFGTFDPIHIGHIKIAKYVEDKFGTKVFFVPTPSSPEKLGQTPVQDRINMLELVLDKEKISKIHIFSADSTFAQYVRCFFEDF